MKHLFSVLICSLLCTHLCAQTNTEVYLLDVKTVEGKAELVNPKNISNNEGYDNQPSFYDEQTILFASTRNGQTDIAKYDIVSGKRSWVTDTPQGSEYSPLKIPGKKAISSIRLDTTGFQRLYEYSIWDGKSTELLKDLKVAYHVWYDQDHIVSAVTNGNQLDLVVSNLRDSTHQTLQKKIGRSLHRIPDSPLISFISKEKEDWEIKSLNPKTGEIKKIADMFANVDDMSWLANGRIIAADDQILMELDPKSKSEWRRFLRFERKGINNISRIAVSPNGQYFSLVVEQSPEVIVQNQLDAYNARDLDAFLNTYSKEIKVFNFPNGLVFEGKENMRAHYGNFFESTPDLNCDIKKRIVIGNKVIDEEYITMNGTNFSAVAIYEVENGKIAKVTFIR